MDGGRERDGEVAEVPAEQAVDAEVYQMDAPQAAIMRSLLVSNDLSARKMEQLVSWGQYMGLVCVQTNESVSLADCVARALEQHGHRGMGPFRRGANRLRIHVDGHTVETTEGQLNFVAAIAQMPFMSLAQQCAAHVDAFCRRQRAASLLEKQRRASSGHSCKRVHPMPKRHRGRSVVAFTTPRDTAFKIMTVDSRIVAQ